MDFDKLLLKPNIESFDANIQRIRRNLIVTSIIAGILSIGSVSIDNSQNGFAGLKLKDLDVIHVYILLISSLVYFAIHFIWSALDHLKENRLRLTGINIPKARLTVAIASPTFEPNADESNQSTMFSWWKGHRKQFEQLSNVIKSINNNVNDDKLTPAVNTAKQHIEEFNSKTGYIEHALLKFEQGFWSHQRSQIIRWFLLDFGVPCVLALSALILLVGKIIGLMCL
jgi:hypothetical protein